MYIQQNKRSSQRTLEKRILKTEIEADSAAIIPFRSPNPDRLP